MPDNDTTEEQVLSMLKSAKASWQDGKGLRGDNAPVVYDFPNEISGQVTRRGNGDELPAIDPVQDTAANDQPAITCNNHKGDPINLDLRGVVACPGKTAPTDGTYVLPFLDVLKSGGESYCRWFLDDGTYQYLLVYRCKTGKWNSNITYAGGISFQSQDVENTLTHVNRWDVGDCGTFSAGYHGTATFSF